MEIFEAPPAPVSPLATAISTFSNVGELVARIEELANRLVGSVPQNAAQAAANNRVDDGLLSTLGCTADRAADRLMAGHNALTRIERALP